MWRSRKPKLPSLGQVVLRSAFALPDCGRLLYILNPAGIPLFSLPSSRSHPRNYDITRLLARIYLRLQSFTVHSGAHLLAAP